jgi:tRNA modification GTPase
MVEGQTVLDREVLAHLPLAKTEAGVRMLLGQPAAWRAFADSRPTPQGVRAVLSDQTLVRLLNPARVAIVGKPNVGKSTLANQLFGQDRSITADVPGTTRDWVGELANLDGLPVMLVDTPGVRESEDPIEREAIARSGTVVQGADVLVYVIDATAPVPAPPGSLPVLNKSDRRTPANLSYDVATVATSGRGIDELRRLIRHALGADDLQTIRPLCWTDRQRQALQRDPRNVLVGDQQEDAQDDRQSHELCD